MYFDDKNARRNALTHPWLKCKWVGIVSKNMHFDDKYEPNSATTQTGIQIVAEISATLNTTGELFFPIMTFLLSGMPPHKLFVVFGPPPGASAPAIPSRKYSQNNLFKEFDLRNYSKFSCRRAANIKINVFFLAQETERRPFVSFRNGVS